MKNVLIKLFGIKQKIHYYGMFLKNDIEIKKSKPSLVKSLAHDIDIELYVLSGVSSPKGYAKAVIVVKKGNRVFRTKYDGGRLLELSPDDMLRACINNIKQGWDLRLFRKWAYEAFENETSWLDKWAFGI